MAWSSSLSLQAWDGINQCERLLGVVTIGSAQLNGGRNSPCVADQMTFAAQLGPVSRVRPRRDGRFTREVQIARFRDGKIVERWGNSDQLGILQQIGARATSAWCPSDPPAISPARRTWRRPLGSENRRIGYGLNSTRVPLGTIEKISWISSLVTAIYPSVQSTNR
jgi:hypothetical protein